MERIRVAKVDNVLCSKLGRPSASGTLHLTAHHLIFRYADIHDDEIWLPYPLIAQVTRLPQTLQGHTPLTVRCRTFEITSFSFLNDGDAVDVFDSIKELTVVISVTQLYAFFYQPSPPLPTSGGWDVYSPKEEFRRLGVGTRSKAWRFTALNTDYSLSPTYPAVLVIPSKISDTTLQYAAKYRSKGRFPALSYLHWANSGSLTRSSQPMVGLTNSRSVQDEKLVEAIFQSHLSPDQRSSSAVYGSTKTNLIMDARPTANAMANTAKGAGTENMDNYRDSKKIYLGIDHIHAMRESLAKLAAALQEADVSSVAISGAGDEPLHGEAQVVTETGPLDRQALRRSGWLRHLGLIMDGVALTVKNIHVHNSHVLVHCSDGWDRTALLTSLSMICLDPFYRTIRGFEVLVEKEWVSFGHKFLDRCGHLSSEKFFVAPVEGGDAAQTFLASVQNRFGGGGSSHIKEMSPIFHQFLECARQIQRQFPERFEYNERFFRQLYYHLYSCQFGTFLYNCERERRVGENGQPPPCERTTSVWDFFNTPAEMEQNTNSDYDPSLDDHNLKKGDMGVLFFDPKDVKFWHQLYGRTDEEMNGRLLTKEVQDTEVVGPVDAADDDPVSPERAAAAAIREASAGATSTLASLSSAVIGNAVRISRGSSPSPSSTPTSADSRPLSASPPADATSPYQSYIGPRLGTTSYRSPPPRQQQPSPSPSGSGLTSFASRTSTRQFNQADLQAGFKSVWGKLSSNASAAFSAVQDAYDGMAQKTNEGGSDAQVGELRDRGALGAAWGDSSPSFTPSSSVVSTEGLRPSATITGSVIESNPWATSSTSRPSRSAAQTLSYNPWASTRSPSPPPKHDLRDMFSSQRSSALSSSPDPLSTSSLPLSAPPNGQLTSTTSRVSAASSIEADPLPLHSYDPLSSDRLPLTLENTSPPPHPPKPPASLKSPGSESASDPLGVLLS